jgi:hypothetical protein
MPGILLAGLKQQEVLSELEGTNGEPQTYCQMSRKRGLNAKITQVNHKYASGLALRAS